MIPKKLSHDDYTVGWICPLEVEQIAALEMLDEEHERLPQSPNDHNVYTLGSIDGHNIVTAGLPLTGNSSAATVVTQMRMTYPNIRFGLLVGIGGGMPVKTGGNEMICLGNIVVSKPTGLHSGVLQYDHGKAEAGLFRRTGSLAPPPAVLLNAAQELAVRRARSDRDPIAANIKRIDTTRPGLRMYKHPGLAEDRLYRSQYLHSNPGSSCDECGCDLAQLVERKLESEDDNEPKIVVHRGTVASGEMVIKDAIKRDQLAKEHDILCFEMEAAGVLADFPCIVIRGISDYCDSHKNDQWHGYAAAAAAAYGRQLFHHMPVDKVKSANDGIAFKQSLRSHIESIEHDVFLSMLSTVDQAEYKTKIAPGQIDQPKFYWIFRNAEFYTWDASNSTQALWLSGPDEPNICEASSAIVNQENQRGSETQHPVLYFFCSTAMRRKSIISIFIHTLLSQFIRNSPSKKRMVIVKQFLFSLMRNILDENNSENLKEFENNEGRIPEIILKKRLVVPSRDLWNALETVLVAAKQDLVIVVDALDKVEHQQKEFVRGIRIFVENLQIRIPKVRILLTSRPQAEIKEILSALPCIEYDKERRECLATLRFQNTRHGKISREHQGSFEWLWRHAEYHDWSTPDASRLLYIQGKPGSGKSTLAKYFGNNIFAREAAAKSAIIAKFFYSFREGELQTSHHSMLQSLLFDILNQDESFFYHKFQAGYRQYKSHSKSSGASEPAEWPYSLLKEILSSLQDHVLVPRVYLIIDAIDESDENDRRQVLNLLFNICSNAKHCIVKVFVASRPVGQLDVRKDRFNNFIKLQDETKSDISSFAHSFLQDLRNTGILGQAVQYIVDNAQGVFLWVQLVGEELLRLEEQGYAEEEIFTFLKSLPTELEAFYTHMFQRVEREGPNHRDAIKMFQFVLFAKHTLSVPNLLQALAIPDSPHSEFEPIDETFRKRIPSYRRIVHCGGNFLEIRPSQGVLDKSAGNGIVQIIHQTVREFFLRPDGRVANSEFQVIEKSANRCIAVTCIRSLMLLAANTISGKRPSDIEMWTAHDFDDYVQYLQEMPLANYALCYMTHHLDDCQDVDVSDMFSKFIDGVPSSPAFHLLEDWIHFRSDLPHLNIEPIRHAGQFRDRALYSAAKSGYETATEMLLIVGAYVDVEDFRKKTPLSCAAENGHEGVAKLLLEKGANPESKDAKYRQTPLLWAAQNGRESVVQLLLENGADLESKSYSDHTPLSLAAFYGHETVVRLLVEGGADLKSKAGSNRLPLSFAAENGHIKVVKYLLERDAGIDYKSHTGLTPLSWAAQSGQTEVVRLLLEKGAFLEEKEKGYGQTALSLAAKIGHDAVVKVLLEKGAEIESKSKSGQTSLSWAAENAQETVVKVLLDKGADIESRSKSGRTPLLWAAQNGQAAVMKVLIESGAVWDPVSHNEISLLYAAKHGHEEVVKLLLEKGVNIESRDEEHGQTPLSWAASNGHEGVVMLLLERCTEMQTQLEDADYRQTPLSWAARNGHEGIVRLLLEDGANLESKDEESGQTPLSWAAKNGHEPVVILLLEQSAEIETQDKCDRRTPLSWAARNGHVGIIRILLENGASIESKDEEYGQTPLSWAARNGHEPVVTLLLENGADIEAKDKYYKQTPLLWAARNGHEGITRVLLEKGADMESRDVEYGQTPLSWASQNGHERVMNVLVEWTREKSQPNSQCCVS